jgi:hypothetical protein
MMYSHLDARQIFEIKENPDSFGFPGFARLDKRGKTYTEKRFTRFTRFREAGVLTLQ